jgi:hypothetical protein
MHRRGGGDLTLMRFSQAEKRREGGAGEDLNSHVWGEKIGVGKHSRNEQRPGGRGRLSFLTRSAGVHLSSEWERGA